MKGHTSVMPLSWKMGHVLKRSQKLVLELVDEKTAVEPRPRMGTATAAPTGLEAAATAATAAELAAAATRAAPEKIKRWVICTTCLNQNQLPLANKI